MADSKITALTSIGASTDPANDPLVLVDVSDTSMAATGTTKKVTLNQLLGAGGTATLASATITGDLTVDTSTLKVDSANDRVGVGTASPATRFHVALAAATYGEVARFYDASGNGISLTANASSGFNQLTSTGAQPLIFNVNSGERYRIGSDGTATWSVGGSTAMTLNSTGLGVGTIPGSSTGNARFAVLGGATYDGQFNITANFSDTALSSAKGVLLGYNNTTNNGIICAAYGNGTEGLQFWTHNGSNWGARMTLDSPGNVGVGVTPSARFHSKAGAVTLGGIIETGGANSLLSFADSATSSYTRVQIGSSGNNLVALINGSTALTLNSSNSLVLGSAAIATTATDGFLYIPGCAGTPTGTPTAQTGRVPLVVDTTNNKLYFYSGGSWVAAN
jgi:hypothetical protein